MTEAQVISRPRQTLETAAIVLTFAALAWGILAFGSVYSWASNVLAVLATGAGVASFAVRSAVARPASREVILSLAAIAVAILAQLVDLPLAVIAAISPNTLDTTRLLDPMIAAGLRARHPLSIGPALTWKALALYLSLAVLFLGTTRLLSITRVSRFASVLSAFGVGVAVLAIIQEPLSPNKVYGFWVPDQGAHVFGPFINRNHFAGCMLMIAPLTLGHVYGRFAKASVIRSRDSGWRVWLLRLSDQNANHGALLGFGAGVMLLALFMTFSRSAILAFGAACTATVVVVGRRPDLGRRWRAAVLLIIVIVGAAYVAGTDALVRRFAESNWSQLNDRLGPWGDAARVAGRFPITGTGLNTYGMSMLIFQEYDLRQHYREAHNDYLQLAAEGGLLLVVPVTAAVVTFILMIRRRFAEDTMVTTYWLRVGAVTGLLAIALQEAGEFSLQMPGNAALFSVLCAIALHQSRFSHNRTHAVASAR